MGRKTPVIPGQRFGRLTVISEGPPVPVGARPGGRRSATCQCDCGAKATVTLMALAAGTTRSCGCLNRELAAGRMRELGPRTLTQRTESLREWHARDANAVRQIVGYECPTHGIDATMRASIVLDPFGGTGTTALVADILGRTGITVDRSADYCRIARWRTTDPGERARAMLVPKPPPVPVGQVSLFDLDGEAS